MLTHDRKILLLALIAGLPGVAASLALLWFDGYAARIQWTLTVLIVAVWLGCSFTLRSWIIVPLQTISNLLAALREEDYSIRARGARPDDALGQVFIAANELGQTLQEQRRGAVEANALLRTVMVAVDVAMFTFDGQQRLQLANRAGERLLGRSAEQLYGQYAEELALKECLEGETPRILPMSFPGGSGRWEARRSTVREHGLPHQLILLTDLSRALREEEQQAWRRLVRVIGHELNNSLTPIKSIAGSLERILKQNPLPDEWQEDMNRGLGIVGARADALGRFMTGYAQLAKLPPPDRAPLYIGPWIRSMVALETRLPVAIEPGPAATIQADAGQLEQALINLLGNAVDAALETGGKVVLGWQTKGSFLEIRIEDEGPGLPNTANLFVPFFTTKPGGSGIGLVLSRQIVENHQGILTLENRSGHHGCIAKLRLPLR